METPPEIAQIAENLLKILGSAADPEARQNADDLRDIWAADGCPIDEIALEIDRLGCEIPIPVAEKFFQIENLDDEYPDAAEILQAVSDAA